jgi:TonB family protein
MVLISFAPSLKLKGHKPLQMVWVELPRGTSDEIGTGLKEAQGLPKSTIQEQKELLKQKEPDETVMKEPARPDKKKVPPPPPKPEKKLTGDQKKMKDALAKIDKQLKNRVIQPEAAQTGGSGEGYKYGTSDKPLRVSIDDPEYVKYQAMVRSRIIAEWIIPARYSEMAEGARPKARIVVMINEDGEVLSTEWERRSGNASFDASCIRAVQRASPFEVPAERLKWEAYNEGFLVEFDPRLKP